MTLKSEQTPINWMLLLSIRHAVALVVPVVKTWRSLGRRHASVFLKRTHLSNVPNFEQLVFAVARNIQAIALAAHVGDTLSVANKHSHGPVP